MTCLRRRGKVRVKLSVKELRSITSGDGRIETTTGMVSVAPVVEHRHGGCGGIPKTHANFSTRTLGLTDPNVRSRRWTLKRHGVKGVGTLLLSWME